MRASVFLAALALTSWGHVAKAAWMDADLLRVLRALPTETAEAEKPHQVVVHLTGRYDLSQLPAKFPSSTERNRYLIRELENYNRKAAAKLIAFLKGPVAKEVQEVTPIWLTNSLRVIASRKVIEQIGKMNAFHSVVLDEARPLDETIEGGATLRTSRYAEDPDPAWGVEKIRALQAWETGALGQGVLVAVVDSGAAIKHPDLAPNIWRNPGETGLDASGKDKASNGVDDDANGFVDDSVGWNFEENRADVVDVAGHGSQVAGIIAGNGAGGVQTGVAPKAKLMILRTCCGKESNEIFESRAWQAIQYAMQNGARIISQSLSAKNTSNPSYARWRQAGEILLAADILHVNSSGNRGTSLVPAAIGAPGNNPPAWFHPSQTPGKKSSMVTVGAVDGKDRIRRYSSTGPVTWEKIKEYADYVYDGGEKPGLTKPEVCAPSETPSTSLDGKSYTDSFMGTSSATPHVAGLAALILSARPDLDIAQVTEAMEMSAVPAGKPNQCGAGRIDAYAAVDYARKKFK